MKLWGVLLAFWERRSPPSRGAWIEIYFACALACALLRSPPSRGAWIEIAREGQESLRQWRRPPRGGRGLKYIRQMLWNYEKVSPPSRGAWIEIAGAWCDARTAQRRPPRGGRGLSGRCVRVFGLLRHFYWVNVVQELFARCRSSDVQGRFPYGIFFILYVCFPFSPFVPAVVIQPPVRIIRRAAFFVPRRRN